MSIRAIIRPVLWHLGLDKSEGAPKRPLYKVQCATCDEESECSEGTQDPQEEWAMGHTARNPSHQGFRFIVTHFWRMTAVDGTVATPEECS